MKKIQFNRHQSTTERAAFFAFFDDLGYKWSDVIEAHGAISKGYFCIDVDGMPTELEYGDFIVYDNGKFSIERHKNSQSKPL